MKHLHDYSQRADRQAFYRSSDWKYIREYKLYKTPLCERCASNDIVNTATEVHHLLDIKDRPDLRLEITNLQSLCHECHNIITVEAQHNTEKNFKPYKQQHVLEVKKLNKNPK